MAVFSKIPYFNNKRGVSIYMGIWEWKEVPKTDKYPLVQKGKNCKQKGVRW